MLLLPAIEGRFPVGVTTFTTPVRPARSIGSAKLKSPRASRQDASQHAFFLEEVAFTAYYPADVDVTSKKGIPWFLRPIRESLRGFSAFLGVPSWLLWPIVYFFGTLLQIPAYQNAPLLSPPEETLKSDDLTSLSQWPLMIFSHGLGGNRTAYSQFCCRMAASGKVVLAIEHRDGTGPVCMPRSWNLEGKSLPRILLYLRETDIHWDDSDSIDVHPIPLRGQQLAFRHQEIYIAYATFCRFMQGDPTLEFETIDSTSYDKGSWTKLNESGQQVIRYDDRIILAGHSFGGCTLLSMLSTLPLEGFSRIPVERTIILDPWLEPLPSPGPVPLGSSPSSCIVAVEEVIKSEEATMISSHEKNDYATLGVTIHPRMLVINSETFTLWKDHYTRLQEVVAGWEPHGGKILTLVGSVHVSFSDFPLLPIFRKRTALPIMDVITKLSLAFLDDKLDETLRTVPTTKMDISIIGVKKDGKPKRKLIGNPGDVIVQ